MAYIVGCHRLKNSSIVHHYTFNIIEITSKFSLIIIMISIKNLDRVNCSAINNYLLSLQLTSKNTRRSKFLVERLSFPLVNSPHMLKIRSVYASDATSLPQPQKNIDVKLKQCMYFSQCQVM
jgi:hypothetical protein